MVDGILNYTISSEAKTTCTPRSPRSWPSYSSLPQTLASGTSLLFFHQRSTRFFPNPVTRSAKRSRLSDPGIWPDGAAPLRVCWGPLPRFVARICRVHVTCARACWLTRSRADRVLGRDVRTLAVVLGRSWVESWNARLGDMVVNFLR